MIGVLGGLSLIVGLFSLIDTSTSTSFSVTYLVIGIVLLIIYFAKEIIPETNFGRKKLMKLSFSIKSTEMTIAAIVEEYKAEIIDVVISQIGARSSEELLTVGGKNLLKDELVNDINGVLNNIPAEKKFAKDSVKTILFTTFVIK